MLVYIIIKQKNTVNTSNQETKKDSLSQEEKDTDIETVKETTIEGYVLDNPKLKFNYPSNYKVTTSSDSKFVTVKIDSGESILQIKMFEAVGGPGAGTTFEAKNLGSVSIGQILGNDAYRTQTSLSSYIYSSEAKKCVDYSQCDVYEPECACNDIDNYVLNSLLSTNLTWSPSLNGTTYINFIIEGNPSEEDLKNFDTLVLSLKSL